MLREAKNGAVLANARVARVLVPDFERCVLVGEAGGHSLRSSEATDTAPLPAVRSLSTA